VDPGGRVGVVVGGGIAGLAAAWELSGRPEVRTVVVLEADDRLGGKIRTAEVGGHVVDLGPDAFLARRPEAVALCREIGIADELTAPGSRRAYVWSRGKLRALPEGLALGIPTRIGPVLRSGILPFHGLARAGLDLIAVSPAWRTRRSRPTSPAGATPDRAIGDIVRSCLGPQVVDRFVDPLIGGIHAGPVDAMSAAAVYPPLLEAAARPGSLLRALRRVTPPAGPPDAPVFLTPRAGLGRLTDALAAALGRRGVRLRTSSPVTALEHAGARWRLQIGPGGLEEADVVVLATPAPVSARLLGPLDPETSVLLSTTEYASVAVLTFVVPASAVGRHLDGTGFLVPAVEQWLTTACTWMSAKWPHLPTGGDVVIRASVGRFGDERAAALGDDDLLSAVWAELAPVLRITGTPAAALVTRWHDAFPQYAVGHLERVAAVERGVDALGAIALAGAAYRGVGIPACIASGRRAARRVLGIDEPLSGAEARAVARQTVAAYEAGRRAEPS